MPGVRYNLYIRDCLSFRRRTHVCSLWDYKYAGTSKELGKTWNDRLITFVPMLTHLTESTCDVLKMVAADESAGLLLFQRPLTEIKEVGLNYFFFHFLSVSIQNICFSDSELFGCEFQ